MSETHPYRWIEFYGAVIECLPGRHFRSVARILSEQQWDGTDRTLVVALAGDLIARGPEDLPDWVNTETHYLVILDVPEQAILRLASILRLHKPDRRLQVCRDAGVVERLVISLSRSTPWQGILDAYFVPQVDSVFVIFGDMTVREFPKARIPKLRKASTESFKNFKIDSAGSFLYWPDLDVHMGASQLLQAVDPMYLADVEIGRYAEEKISLALSEMRNERNLKQTEIEGLSDRHVRRLENEEVRLTVDAAEKLALAFGLSLDGFLEELSKRIVANRADSPIASSAL